MAARYEALLKLASGGMATVWIGTARGALGFRQLVAIKKPHPHLLESPGFRDELIAEARLASMIRHANVVDVRDVEVEGSSLSLVMDFIEGASLGELLVAASQQTTGTPRLPPRVAVRILRDACAGLHAAHELVDERSRPVGLVHRDISPQNILVGEDGIARVTDFGVAKFAKKNMQSTSNGSLKGKLAYMAPEYLRGEAIDRRFDIFAVGVVLWEALTGKRCFRAESEAETMRRILDVATPPVSSFDPQLKALDSVIACALEKDATARFQNAAAMGAALENAATEAGLLGSHTEVAAALKALVGPKIDERRELIRSKLAHEPSLASIGGGDVMMSPVISELPETKDAKGREHESVPKTEIAPSRAPDTTPSDPPPSATRTTPGLPEPAAAFFATMPLAAAPAAAFGATLPSPAVAPNAFLSTLASPGGEPAEEVLRRHREGAHHDAVPVPPQRSLVPILMGGAFLVVALGGAAWFATHRSGSEGDAKPAPSAPAAVSTPAPPPSAAPAVASSVPAPSATPSAVRVVPMVPSAVKPKPKRPPANPYE